MPAAAVASDIVVVEFSPDGTPNPSTIFLDDTITGAVLAFGGIAFDPELGAIIQVGVNGTDPACPTGAGVCLMTYDPETGLATSIGGSGMLSTPFVGLTSCTSAIYTTYDPDGFATATVDPDTGAVTDGVFLDDPIAGFDCAPGTDTLYAIAGRHPDPVRQRHGGVRRHRRHPRPRDRHLHPDRRDLRPRRRHLPPRRPRRLRAGDDDHHPTTIDVANADAVAPAFTG